MTIQPHKLPLDAPPVGRVIATYNAYHLGDNLLSLHFLRALAKAHPEIYFTHAAPKSYLPQLAYLTADLRNLTLTDLNAHSAWPRLDTWLGAHGWFYTQPDRADFVAIYLRHFSNLALWMGLPCPFTTARDLLFDYPALERGSSPISNRCQRRILVINSAPQSGQFQSYDPAAFDRIITSLTDAGHLVYATAPSRTATLCTIDTRMDITAIGRLSQAADVIIGVPTGPMWPTFNIWNADTITLRLLLLDTERVDILPESTVHANHLSLVPEILKDRGLL
jgi:hypothetical protein